MDTPPSVPAYGMSTATGEDINSRLTTAFEATLMLIGDEPALFGPAALSFDVWDRWRNQFEEILMSFGFESGCTQEQEIWVAFYTWLGRPHPERIQTYGY